MCSRRHTVRPLSALISTLLCCLLAATPAASSLQGGTDERGARPNETPPTKGAPGPNLPHLDEVRRRGPADPKALPPIPSKLKRCPPDEPNCNARSRGAGQADAGSHGSPSLTYLVLGALAAGLNNPYAGVLLASSGSGIPEPPPSRVEDTPAPPATGWFASVKGFFVTTAATPSPEGVLEPETCEYISGWAWDAAQPTTPVMVALFDGAQLVASVRADRYRADLVAAGKGDGRHGFRIPVPDSLRDANTHNVSVKILGAGSGSDPDYTLAYSPKILGPCGAPAYGGDILSAGCDMITGKAWDTGRPATPIDVDVYVREGGVDVFRARVAADVYDAGIGVGDNRHLFRLLTPAVARDGQPHVITARPAGKDASHNFATQPTVTCAAPVYEGQFNSAGCDYLTGWAWDSTRPDAPVPVEVVENGRVVAAALADTLRPDIPITDGKRHGFRIPVPASLRDGLVHSLSLRVNSPETTLGGLMTLSCQAQAGPCGPKQDLPTTEFVKDFYMGVFERQPRPVELQYWNDALRTAASQGQAQALAEAKRLGRELFLQAEYAGRGRMTSATAGLYVADLYWGYLQRGPDTAGHAHWTGAIQSGGGRPAG